MKQKMFLGFIFTFLIALTSTVTADSEKNTKADDWQQAIAASDDMFDDWTGASIRKLYSEAEGAQQVEVWTVERNGNNLGYFATADGGRTLLEYSPVTPADFRIERKGTYNYVGPGMHLFHESESAPGSWINLSNGELLPAGTITEHVPGFSSPQMKVEQRHFTTDSAPDNGVAVMIQHGLKQTTPFSLPELYNSGNKGGYLVFTALEKDYYSVLAVKGVTSVMAQPMLQVEDTFSNSGYSLYIRTDVPVNWVGSK